MQVFLALGSNIGNRQKHLFTALTKLRRIASLKDTSFLYDTKAMYEENQSRFLNAVCKVETDMSPSDLLHACKRIEKEMGREKTYRMGPRVIDVDILFYGNDVVKINKVEGLDDLTIPHQRIAERGFVLKPMCDIAPDYVHPVTKKTVREMLSAVDTKDCVRVLPLPNGEVLNLQDRLLIMGILNVTPDSFSDGGKWNSLELAVSHAMQMIEEGADILDIGGESTRPGASTISAEEEIRRVIPVVRALREAGVRVPISVDTYRSEVARSALEAGADLINDISAGENDPAMLPFLAESAIPVVLMHKRGNATTMDSMTQYSDVVSEVASYCRQRADSLMALGAPRWNIIVDPGLGFAKNTNQNCQLVREIPRFNQITGNMPLLIAASRKRFVGEITKVAKAEDRVMGTAAISMYSAEHGAQIVRVHDVKQTKQVLDMYYGIVHK